jgi:hypothetical protein
MKPFRKYQLYDFCELIFIIIGSIGSICSIYGVYQLQPSHSFSLLIVIIIASMFAGFTKINKLRQVAATNLKHLSSCFHNTAHTIRNEHAALCKRFNDKKNKLTVDELTTHLNLVGKNVVDNLSTILNELTGEKINVCIKYFCISTPVNFGLLTHEQKQNLQVTVLSRCKYSEKRRGNTKDNLVDNTDLKWITFEQHKHFAEADLFEFSKRLKAAKGESYSDSNPAWRETFNAKITVPIQLDLSYVKPNVIKEKAYDLLGFITADSKSTSAFRDDNIHYFVEICKAYADILYRYLERFIFLWGQLQTYEINEPTQTFALNGENK